MSDTINYDIIVIGAGCGGLSAALCAAKEGKRVLVLERNNAPAGHSSSFIRGRFEFEAYPQDIPGFSPDDSGETKKLFDYMGVTDKIQWLKVPEAYRVISKFSDGTKLDATMPFGIENYIEAMEKYVPGSKAPLTKLFKIAEEIEASADRFTTDNLDSSVSFLKFLKNNGCFVNT